MNSQPTRVREQEPPVAQHPLPRSARRAVLAMYTGLALTVLAILALVYDLASVGGLDRHLHEVYEGYVASPPDAAGVAVYLFTLGGLGIVGWLWMVWAVRRQKRWARPVATLLFLLGSVFAVGNLTVTEYDQTILPTSIGLVGLLPCLAGLVAVVLLWRRRQHRRIG